MSSENAVIFSVTGSFFQLTATAIVSLIERYQSTNTLDVIVVCENVEQGDIEFVHSLPKLLNKPQISVQMWQPPSEVKRIKPDFTIGVGVPVPPMAIWRLFFPNYFSFYHKIIYLDSDLLVHMDIGEMFNLLDNEHLIAAVPDFLFYAGKEYENSDYRSDEGLKHKDFKPIYGIDYLRNYFNNGVMIINVEMYNNLITIERLLDLINTTNYHLADQTLVNILADGKVQYLPFRYNYQHGLDWVDNMPAPTVENRRLEIRAEYPNIKIRHFAGTGKLTPPYLHVRLVDEWEQEFLRIFMKTKRLSLPENVQL